MKTKFLILVSCAFAVHTYAGSATWSSNPTSSDWNTAANWMPNTVPNSLTDVATFGNSAVTDVTLTEAPYNDIDSIVFNPGADSYTISASNIGAGPTFGGAGIVNNSGVTQHFSATQHGLFYFFNSASAGDNTDFSLLGGEASFEGAATAATAHFTVSDFGGVSFISFDASAASATFDIGLNGGVELVFADAPNATFNIVGGDLFLSGSVFLGTSVIDCSDGGTIELELSYIGPDSAGTPQITVHGAKSRSARRCEVYFLDAAMDRSTITLEGGRGRKRRAPSGSCIRRPPCSALQSP